MKNNLELISLTKKIIFVVIFFFPLSLIMNKYWGKSFVQATILLGFIFTLYWNFKKELFSRNEENLIKFGTLTFLIALGGFFQQDELNSRFSIVLGGYLPALIPLAILPLLHFYRKFDINMLTIMLLSASVLSGLIALFDWNSGLDRYHRLHGSPIMFGNLSMLFGVLTLLFSSKYYGSKRFGVFLIAGLIGIGGSFFSGTRGGWIVLLTLPFFWIMLIPLKYRFKALFSYISIVLMIIILVSVTDGSVRDRILLAYEEVVKIINLEGYKGGSLGSRFEFWRVSILAFLQNPIFGIGIGEFYAFKLNLVQVGDVPGFLAKYKHSHSEYFTIISGMGLIGIVLYSVFFIWLWKLFKAELNSREFDKKLIGIAGITTLICYLDFSISESMLSSLLGGGAFYFLMSIYFYILKYDKTIIPKG